MATGKARSRRKKQARQVHLPAAAAAAEAAGRVLVDQYGKQPWILQAMDVVAGGLDNAIRQLSGTAPPTNAASFQQGASYVHPARTADEIKADIAARRQAQPENFQQAFEEEASDQDDLFAQLTRTISPEPEAPVNATPQQPNNRGSVPWVQ